MQHFKWTKAHAIFLPQVDAEHRNLFRMAEELHQAVRTGAEAARVQELSDRWLVAIEEHFAHEERLMRVGRVPRLRRGTSCSTTRRRKRAKRFDRGYRRRRMRRPPAISSNFWRGGSKTTCSLTDRMMGAHVRNYERLHAAAAS